MNVSVPFRNRLIGFLSTDAMATQQVLLACEPSLRDPIGLGVGVLLTSELIRGKTARHPSWSALMPTRDQARAIGAFTTARYSPLTLLARTETKRAEDLLTELQAMFDYLGRVPDILQLDNGFHWPAPAALDDLRARYPELRFLIHLAPGLQARAHYDPAACVAQLASLYRPHLATYGGRLTHVLWDGGGTCDTSELDSAEALTFVQALQKHAPGVEPMFSGGIGPDSLGILDPICAMTRAFSVNTYRPLASDFKSAPDVQRTIDYIHGALRKLAPS